MNGSNAASNRFVMIIGALLLIEGIWGMFSTVVFGVLTTNITHATIHIVLGLVGLWLGSKGNARGYCIFLGILLGAVGILRFVPGVGDLLVSILNVNIAVACVNIVVGIIALVVALRRPVTVHSGSATLAN